MLRLSIGHSASSHHKAEVGIDAAWTLFKEHLQILDPIISHKNPWISSVFPLVSLVSLVRPFHSSHILTDHVIACFCLSPHLRLTGGASCILCRAGSLVAQIEGQSVMILRPQGFPSEQYESFFFFPPPLPPSLDNHSLCGIHSVHIQRTLFNFDWRPF